MKLKELIDYAQSKYNVTIPLPEGASNQEWVEIQGYDTIHKYIQFQEEFVVLGPSAYRLEGLEQEQEWKRPRLFIPKAAARTIFYHHEDKGRLANQETN